MVPAWEFPKTGLYYTDSGVIWIGIQGLGWYPTTLESNGEEHGTLHGNKDYIGFN